MRQLHTFISGVVVLSQCRVCGQAEGDLEEFCPGPKAGALRPVLTPPPPLTKLPIDKVTLNTTFGAFGQLPSAPLAKANRYMPIRKGDIYCSPACGMGCTHADFEKAVFASQALAAELGAGWATRVWDNLGWHWEVSKGKLIINQNKHDRHYTAYIRDVPVNSTGLNAIDAVNACIAQIGRRVESYLRIIEEIKK
jgi:hypothetical protein